MRSIFSLLSFALFASVAWTQAPTDIPVFKVTPVKSTIKFAVKASVPIEGTFQKWDASFTVTSTAVESGVLDIKIQAASVNTGSGMKDETLKLTGSGKGTGHGEITGTMAFDRKEYGMNSGIPFIKIADRVEVTVFLIIDRVSGPPLVFKQ